MDVFDQGVCGEHQSGPAPRFDHRGVIARPDQDVGPRSGQARQQARQQGVFAQVRNRLTVTKR